MPYKIRPDKVSEGEPERKARTLKQVQEDYGTFLKPKDEDDGIGLKSVQDELERGVSEAKVKLKDLRDNLRQSRSYGSDNEDKDKLVFDIREQRKALGSLQEESDKISSLSTNTFRHTMEQLGPGQQPKILDKARLDQRGSQNRARRPDDRGFCVVCLEKLAHG